MDYRRAIAYINSFTKSGAPVADLSRFRALAAALGNPQDKLKFVHVAGTNGKGSVCEYITLGLMAMGKKVGKFTSPYIMRLEERIALNNTPISPERLALCCEKTARAAEKTGIDCFSQFEILTAMAFLYFLEEKTDAVVLETGIGGTLDCTNIVTPLLSVITTVDIDHKDILGNTAAEIAVHKAGIIKENIPAVSSPRQPDEVTEVLRKRAETVHAPFYMAQEGDFTVTETSLYGTDFLWKGRNYHTAMGGAHQALNAVCALNALTLLGADQAALDAAMAARLPARMELIQKDGQSWLIDGGHNINGADAAKALLAADSRDKAIIVGMLRNKDFLPVFRRLLPLAKQVVAVDFFAPNAVPAEEIVQISRSMGVPCKIAPTAEKAAALALEADAQLNCVMGSLYLAGLMRSIICADTTTPSDTV